LQDLRVELGFAEIEEELIERVAVEPLGIKQVPGVKGPALSVSEVVHRALEAFARHGQIFPATLVPEPANEVVLVEPLHHDDHGPFGWVIEARHQRALEPVVDGIADRVGGRLHRLKRIIDDDDVRALAGRPLDRGCEPVPFRRQSHFRKRRAVRRDEGVGEQGLVGA
jgi:hypothetical protein